MRGDTSGAAPGAGAAFRFCPSCGASGPDFLDGKRWLCGECGFEYFHNVATAAGLIIEGPGGIVFIERSREPRKGALGLPGGFVEPGERAEDAAVRECREEIGWAPPELSFLGSYPNSYSYGGIAYSTCDLFFYYRLSEGRPWPAFRPEDGEVLAIRVLPPSGLDRSRLAFPSLELALGRYSSLVLAPRAKGEAL